MNNTLHTPGPWNACYKNHENGEIYFAIMGAPNGLEDNLPHKGAFICKVTGKRERMEANAHLIAAAPDLLAILNEVCMQHNMGLNKIETSLYDIAKTALRKAKGEK